MFLCFLQTLRSSQYKGFGLNTLGIVLALSLTGQVALGKSLHFSDHRGFDAITCGNAPCEEANTV